MRTEDELRVALANLSGMVLEFETMKTEGMSEDQIAMTMRLTSAIEGVEYLSPDFYRGMERSILWVLDLADFSEAGRDADEKFAEENGIDL